MIPIKDNYSSYIDFNCNISSYLLLLLLLAVIFFF